MNSRIFIVFLCLLSPFIRAQVISGQLLDAGNKQPIAYVNIGIVGKGLGTVSDISGNFKITIPDSLNAEIIRFSYIGYTSKSYKVSDVKKRFENKTMNILMEQNAVALHQVVVKPKTYKTKVLGNTNDGRSIIAGFMSNDLGSELGTIMKIKKAPTFIENVNFNIGNNLLDSVKFRVNIYTMKNELPDSIILNSPIYITTKLKYGTVSVDLKKYNLWVNSDFFVSLEWIEDYGKNKLYFSAGLMDSNSMYRKTSQDNWHKAKPIGIGFNSTVTYEK